MDTVVNYLKHNIKPRNSSEFIEGEAFNQRDFDQLVQDGFYVCKAPPPPSTQYAEYVKIGDEYLIKKAIKDLAWLLEDGFGFDDSTEPIYRRLLPPPAEVLDHVTIMKAIASTLGSNINYLEYGVSTGHSLLNMAKVVHKAFGVDVVNNIRAQVPNNTEFFKMTTDRFSEEHVRDLEFSLCFIDADHAFSSAYKDFSNIIKYIKPGGYVFLHDTYPCAKEFLEPYLCNDCYKTPLQIKKDYPSLEVLTLPLQPGLTIVRVPP